jgi:hypothetical protein
MGILEGLIIAAAAVCGVLNAFDPDEQEARLRKQEKEIDEKIKELDKKGF